MKSNRKKNHWGKTLRKPRPPEGERVANGRIQPKKAGGFLIKRKVSDQKPGPRRNGFAEVVK